MESLEENLDEYYESVVERSSKAYKPKNKLGCLSYLIVGGLTGLLIGYYMARNDSKEIVSEAKTKTPYSLVNLL